uniref:WW-binding domain-containing protein n=1 Tax=Gadus morhua TaxID=8049 RepID=A0A8C5F935_GADMO
MTKRRAEDALFGGVPTKTCYGSLCSLDMQLKGSATSGPVDPPSLQALLGSRCRKRPYSPEEADVQESPNNDKNDDSEDISFNYFQFWRTPLPALDLSLLEDEDSKSESRKNVTAKDGMET